MGGDGAHAEQAIGGGRIGTDELAAPQSAAAGLPVDDHRLGTCAHAMTRRRGPPTELDAVAEHGDLGSEPAQGIEDRPLHEHAAGADGEGVG